MFVCAWCSWRPEEGVRSPELQLQVICDPPGGCWELNPNLQEELLTIEPSPQPCDILS